jgi:hypothetical protein
MASSVIISKQKDNLDAVVPPSRNDDIAAGYGVGSLWRISAAGVYLLYVCADASEGAAVWTSISHVYYDVSSNALDDIDVTATIGEILLTGVTTAASASDVIHWDNLFVFNAVTTVLLGPPDYSGNGMPVITSRISSGMIELELRNYGTAPINADIRLRYMLVNCQTT